MRCPEEARPRASHEQVIRVNLSPGRLKVALCVSAIACMRQSLKDLPPDDMLYGGGHLRRADCEGAQLARKLAD